MCRLEARQAAIRGGQGPVRPHCAGVTPWPSGGRLVAARRGRTASATRLTGAHRRSTINPGKTTHRRV